ncbi:Mitochondrial-processing peptidase subunit alpha [Trichinella spiralis]|uniref:Mitochondrial-processing peptidase subunit alpha n=1 Tax=Trichinella spiralis TaxID=6334 RepID=A0A0V1BGF6_TRISP|nr:Mitochondrial-processing peptidase subunit alpha [Trichinella spiralis]
MKWKKLNSDIVRCVMGSVKKCSLTVLLMQGNGGSRGVGGGSGGHDGILTVAEGHLLLTSVHGRSALVQLFSLPICKCTVTLEIASSCSVGWTNHAVRKTTPRSIQVHQLDDRLSLPSRIDFPVGSSGRDPQHGISPRRATCFREDSSSEVFFVLFASAFLLTNSHLLYKKYYPGTTIERLYVPESETRWKVKSENYVPPDYTACPQNWKCDPDDPKGIKFNEIDDELDRRTFVRKKYKIAPDGRPLNPKGKTGIRGRGTLAYWGPNHAMMTIISRGKGNNKEYYVMRSNRTTVEAPFLIEYVKKPMVQVFPPTLYQIVIGDMKEIFPEAAILEALEKFYKESSIIYQGYYTDQRNTDNAWSEFTILEIEDPSKEYFNVVEAKRVTLPETGEEVTFQWEELPEEQVERKVKELIKKSDRTAAEKMLHRMRRAKIYFQKQGIHGLLPVLNDFVSNSIGLTGVAVTIASDSRFATSPAVLKSFSSIPQLHVVNDKHLNDLPDACKVPLSVPLSGLPEATYVTVVSEDDPFKAKISKLNSGLRIASEKKYGEFCTIGGTVVDAGSRYEALFPSGTSHFLEKLAFTSCEKFQTSEEIVKTLEKHGAIVDCQHTKDGIIYAASCRTDAFKPVLEFVADVMFNPIFSDSELHTARQVVESNIEMVNTKPEPDDLLHDLIHAAAYRDNTLGLPKFCPVKNIAQIDQKTLLSFMKTYYTPDRIVVGGVGVDHDQLIEACNEYFEQNVPVWKRRPELLLPQIPDVDKSTAQYTGGEIRIEKDLSNITMSVNPFPELAHVVMGFESCSFMDEDFLCFSLLHSLMGGGGSFSAGGPGKGMYTRWYVNVLNRHHFIYNATSFNISYADTGIFFIRASAHPNHIDSLIAVLCSEFFRMKENLHTEELNRAKSQIKSSLMMNLEQRPVIFEDLTRQILGSGVRKSPLQFLEDIDKLKADDLIRAVDRMLNSRVSLVGYGTLKQMQPYDLIDRAIVNRDLKLLKTPKLYFT